MAAKPERTKKLAKPVEPPNDGFPPEKDVSTPPPGTDQAKDRGDRKRR
jgi:hypothetical protein